MAASFRTPGDVTSSIIVKIDKGEDLTKIHDFLGSNSIKMEKITSGPNQGDILLTSKDYCEETINDFFNDSLKILGAGSFGSVHKMGGGKVVKYFKKKDECDHEQGVLSMIAEKGCNKVPYVFSQTCDSVERKGCNGGDVKTGEYELVEELVPNALSANDWSNDWLNDLANEEYSISVLDFLRDLFNLIKDVSESALCAGGIGIAHRDIKPDNIMVEIDGLKNKAWLIDWGLACYTDLKLPNPSATPEVLELHVRKREENVSKLMTSCTNGSGSPGFVDPNIFNSSRWNELVKEGFENIQKADVWSLGSTVLSLLGRDIIFEIDPDVKTVDDVILINGRITNDQIFKVTELLLGSLTIEGVSDDVSLLFIQLLNSMLKVDIHDRISWPEVITRTEELLDILG